MADRKNGGPRGRGAARGQPRMRMDDPAFNSSKRKRDEEGDPVLNLMSVILRIGDRLRVSETADFVLNACRFDLVHLLKLSLYSE